MRPAYRHLLVGCAFAYQLAALVALGHGRYASAIVLKLGAVCTLLLALVLRETPRAGGAP